MSIIPFEIRLHNIRLELITTHTTFNGDCAPKNGVEMLFLNINIDNHKFFFSKRTGNNFQG